MDRSTADRLALLLATLAARSARPSGVSDCQHLEHSWPRAPVCARPQAWQLSWTAAASRPAWRSRHRRWRSELVGSGIVESRQGGCQQVVAIVEHAGGVFGQVRTLVQITGYIFKMSGKDRLKQCDLIG